MLAVVPQTYPTPGLSLRHYGGVGCILFLGFLLGVYFFFRFLFSVGWLQSTSGATRALQGPSDLDF